MSEVQLTPKTRAIHKLGANIVRTARRGQAYGDGGGLWLMPSSSGRHKWIFRYSFQKRVRECGLGPSRSVTLSRARELAAMGRRELAEGKDPLEAGREPGPAKHTFGECVMDFFASKAPGWRSAKHSRQWAATLENHAAPLLGMPVDEVDTAAVLGILTPIWQTIPETASRLRGRIEAVLDFAKARGLRPGENPAAWRGHLALILPKRQKLSRGHHAAMDYLDVPAFVDTLTHSVTLQSLALQFLILTAARSGEVLGARWDEIDLGKAVWTIPASRMKAGREHRVPLSARAMAILGKLAGVRGGKTVFETSSESLRKLVKGATVHGFRSAFRDWAGEETSSPREIAEAALAHATGNAVERAYRRGDALEKRRVLMAAWGEYCTAAAPNVIPLRA
ncbi:MAG: tyrosine-type recombinase/integrase [Pseudomonadota bacterium]|nr:tyrosine-type recombinase/integrase [Pseudomonadota bacterium]